MSTVVRAEGALLDRVLDATYPASHQGLSRAAFTTLDAALGKTAWAGGHQRRYALIQGTDILARTIHERWPTECNRHRARRAAKHTDGRRWS
jgi:hypothetical protein